MTKTPKQIERIAEGRTELLGTREAYSMRLLRRLTGEREAMSEHTHACKFDEDQPFGHAGLCVCSCGATAKDSMGEVEWTPARVVEGPTREDIMRSVELYGGFAAEYHTDASPVSVRRRTEIRGQLNAVFARLATAEARVRELTAQNDALREALTRIAQGKVDGFDLARDSVVLERCIRIARRAASETPERTER